MDNQAQDNWDELISDLGAERAPEPTTESASTPSPTVPASSFDLDNLPPPEPAASGWDSLLDDFGIDTPAPEPAPAPQPPAPQPAVAKQEPQPAAPVEPVRQEPARDKIAIEQPAFDESPPEPLTAEKSPAPSSPAAPQAAPQPKPKTTAEQKPTPALPDLKASLSLPDWFPFAGRRNKAVADKTQADEAAASNDAPSPTEPEVKQTSPPASDVVEMPPADDAVADETVVAAGAETSPEAEGEAGDRPPRRRRRRRGGRRRRRSSTATEGEANAQPPATDDAESTPASEASASEVAQSVNSQSDDDDELSGEFDASDSSGRGGRGDAAAKVIPSWPEAIGVVVDANIAMRSERKPATAGSSRGGRGGSGRGRSRGRRRRKPAE